MRANSVVVASQAPPTALPAAPVGEPVAAAAAARSPAAPQAKPRPSHADSLQDPGAPSSQDMRDFMHVEAHKQVVDARVTRGLREKLTDLIGKNRLTGSDVQAVLCGERMCEVDIMNASTSAYDSLMKHLNPHDFEWPGERFATPTGDVDGAGAVGMKVFLAREGTMLPTLD
jgi:hypothetical protein